MLFNIKECDKLDSQICWHYDSMVHWEDHADVNDRLHDIVLHNYLLEEIIFYSGNRWHVMVANENKVLTSIFKFFVYNGLYSISFSLFCFWIAVEDLVFAGISLRDWFMGRYFVSATFIPDSVKQLGHHQDLDLDLHIMQADPTKRHHEDQEILLIRTFSDSRVRIMARNARI